MSTFETVGELLTRFYNEVNNLVHENPEHQKIDDLIDFYTSQIMEVCGGSTSVHSGRHVRRIGDGFGGGWS